MGLDLLIAATFYREGTAPILGSMAWIKSLSWRPAFECYTPRTGR
jgi:hypothetical protein